MTTRLPRLASIAARLTAIVVFPSPGNALVIRMIFGTGLADSKIEVRRERKASRTAGSV
jgi:hypothetical protein